MSSAWSLAVDCLAMSEEIGMEQGKVKVLDFPARDKPYTYDEMIDLIRAGNVQWASPLLRLICEERLPEAIREVTAPFPFQAPEM